jgi:hypothetical protein
MSDKEFLYNYWCERYDTLLEQRAEAFKTNAINTEYYRSLCALIWNISNRIWQLRQELS